MRFPRKHDCKLIIIHPKINRETKPSGQLKDPVLKHRLTTRGAHGIEGWRQGGRTAEEEWSAWENLGFSWGGYGRTTTRYNCRWVTEHNEQGGTSNVPSHTRLASSQQERSNIDKWGMTEEKRMGIYEHERCKEACASHSSFRRMTNKKGLGKR